MIKNIILFLSIIMASGVLLTNVYTSLVDAKSWGSQIPESLETARMYFRVVNPGTAFRIISPLTQVLAILALIVFWKSVPSVRVYLAVAVALYVLTDVFTFGYFYPRNAILFGSTTDIGVLKQVWSEWNTMNWLRSLVVFTGLIFSCLSLHKIYIEQLMVKHIQ